MYWDYLAELVKPVVESDVPDPAQYDTKGKHVPGLSQEFAAWAQSHGQSPNEAGEKAVYIWPAFVVILGMTGDSRALPLLRRGFSSRDSMLQVAASRGLAELQDVSSIPMIIARCKAVPPEMASAIAESLVYFDDPDAQKAVDTYVPKEKAKALREQKMAGNGALHGR